MKKIVLKSLAIMLSITSLLNFVPINTSAVDNKNDSNVGWTGAAIEEAKDIGKDVKLWISDHTIDLGLAAVGAVIGIVIDVCALRAYRACKIARIKGYWKNELFKDHIVENNKLTKRSEGYNWEWLACLQGLLKDRGIEKSQKDMYKGISGKSPNIFECFRLNGLSFFEDLNEAKKLKSNYKGTGLLGDGTTGSCVYLGQVRNYVERISNNKYTFKVEYIDADAGKISDVCDKIKEIYIKNGRSPISIMDSVGYVVHASVNIIEIDENDNIIVENPYLELRRKESLEDFVARYRHFRNEKEYIKLTQTFKKNKIPGIPITYVALKNNA